MFNKGDEVNVYFILDSKCRDRLKRLDDEVEFLKKQEEKVFGSSSDAGALFRNTRSALQWAIAYIEEHQRQLIMREKNI